MIPKNKLKNDTMKEIKQLEFIVNSAVSDNSSITTYKLGKIVIVNISCMINKLNMWTDYDFITLPVKSKIFALANLTGQTNTEFAIDVLIEANSDVIRINCRGIDNINNFWYRGQLIFFTD